VISWSPHLFPIKNCRSIHEKKIGSYISFAFWTVSTRARPIGFPRVLLHGYKSAAPLYSLSERKRPRNIQYGGIVLPMANLIADSDSGNPDYYWTFLVTIRLSRLVWEIFAWQTDGQTTRPITTASLHIVAGKWESRGLTSHSTLYRSFLGRFLQVRWPNQQSQSTEGSTEIGIIHSRQNLTTVIQYEL